MTRYGLAAAMLLASSSAQAQLSLFVVNGTAETPVGATYQAGNFAEGTTVQIHFQAQNPGTASVTVSSLGVSGVGFSIVRTSSVPYVVSPGGAMDITVQFAAGSPAAYSANFQVNTISVILVVTVVAVPNLSVQSPCTGPNPNTGGIAFGTIQSGQTEACVLSLQNSGAQSITVSTLTISGAGFHFTQMIPTPILIPAGGLTTFTVNFAPSSSAVYSGTLTVGSQATQTYPLTGSVINPPLPTPQIQFDSGAYGSDQQRTVTMSLPSPSPIASTGVLLLSFKPGTTVVTDDPAIVFVANGSRSMPFSINAGDTQFQFQGQTGAVFQTGTTWGTITFNISTDVSVTGTATASMSIPPSVIKIDKAIATTQTSALNVQVSAYDNTYSAGPMSFTLYDLKGNVIQPGAVSADFTSQFYTYFTTAQAGELSNTR
ncbi:MAG TPA: choice-of-anchor D domain-containing protein [Bryobacteraceae bacterium]